MKVYLSHELDPFFHLKVEEWLLRESGEEAFFIYRNRPSVVLGRFQNPWLECDLAWMKTHDIKLVRRPSGGGTVWHDEGNVNFCWVGDLKGFDKNRALQKIQGKLAEFGLEVVINARHDLVVPLADGTTRKVSGSAYKQTKDRALHHGTLLLQSDLTALNRVLKSPHTLLETRSIASVRSQVMNLGLGPEDWMNSWGHAQIVTPDETRFQQSDWSRWEWLMGETPLFKWEFSIEDEWVSLSAHKGKILELTWPQQKLEAAKIEARLEAQTFFELSGGRINLEVWQNFLGR